MRVLFVINGLGTGGSERSLAELLPALGQRGVEPLVACLHHRPEGVQSAVEALGFDVRVLADGSRLQSLARLRRLLRSWAPHLVHTSIFEADVLGRLGAWGSRLPVLTTLVNTSYDPTRLRDPGVRRGRLEAVRIVDALTARYLTTHFHAVTAAVKAAAVSTMGLDPQRISVVERGRDPARLGRAGAERRQRARTALGLAAEDEVVLNVGRQEYQKNQVRLLEAMRILLVRRPRSVLLVAGRRGNASAALDRLTAEIGAADRIRFLGHTEEIPDLLAAADVFAFPSLYEGTGGAAIEAMALSLPIVASDIPAMREVLEDQGNAVLVPPTDPEAIAGALAGLLDDDRRRQAFGARSRAIFEDRFTLERSAEDMCRLYERVAAAGRRGIVASDAGG